METYRAIKDTSLIGKIDSRQAGLKVKIDTLTFRGHIMYGSFYRDDKLILDFGDDAIEPVYEVCGE